jgi:HEAT repeat protein
MAQRTLDEAIAALQSPDAAVRISAADGLRDMVPRPVAAIPALLAHLGDRGSVEEEWTDWTGDVIGATTHVVVQSVVNALVRIGTPALTALLDAVEAGQAPAWALPHLVTGVPMDALLAAGPDAITRAKRCAPGDDSELALSWAQEEILRDEDRTDVLGRRLFCPIGPTKRLAAEELGTANPATAVRAAILLAEALLHEPGFDIDVQRAAATSLDKLGPVLAPSLAARLIAITPTRAMFYCWPELLPAVASYGQAASSLGPWLLAWVRDEQSPVQIGSDHHRKVRWAAASAIGRLGDAARALHNELADIYDAGPHSRRELVLRALPDCSPLVAKFGARWRKVLKTHDRAAIEAALGAIQDCGPAAVPLLDAILPYLEGAKADYRAVATIGKLGEAARPVVPTLVRALEDPRVSTWACHSLGNLGPDIARDAIAPLETLAARDHAAGERNSTAGFVLRKWRGE